MKQSVHYLNLSGILIIMSLWLVSCHNVANEKYGQHSDLLKNAYGFIISSQINRKADNGNVIFSLYNRDGGYENLWFYKLASNKLGMIPYSMGTNKFSISKNGRFAVYFDERTEIDGVMVHDGLLIYDIENERLVHRIGIGDNFTTFKFLGDILIYTIDTGEYLYDPLRNTDVVSSTFLNNYFDIYANRCIEAIEWPEEFTLSNDGNCLAVAQSITQYADKEYRELVLYRKENDGQLSREVIRLPHNNLVFSVEFNPSSNLIGVCYEEVDSMTVIGTMDKSVRKIAVHAPEGLITWENDSNIRIDYSDYSEKIHLE